MASAGLDSTLRRFQRTVRECQRLADDARRWSAPGAHPRLTPSRRDSMVELAFLRVFLAWESFLEETFILFVLGNTPTGRRVPIRFVNPPNRPVARELVADGRPYAKWTADEVRRRSTRFFRGGWPFEPALKASQQALQDLNTVRNAVAHDSEDSWEKFKKLVRRDLKTLPSGLTVGKYLDTVRPGTTPATSFMDHYLATIVLVADAIVDP